MLIRSNRLFRQRQDPRFLCSETLIARRSFYTSTPLRNDGGLPDHYETLGLQPNASAGEVKKKFYSLSKTHHPDHNPNDPNASERFVAISEAYATLGSTEKRSRYDRDFLRSAPSHQHHQTPPGSHSSHSSPAGGRSASGLSRRRTQFRGPPPSFFRNGGWGTQGAKRAEHASNPSHQHQGPADSKASGDTQEHYASDAPGTGPSGFSQGFDNDVPHFDRDGHFRTQESVLRMRHRARRRQSVSWEDMGPESGGPSMLFSFVLLSGVLGTIYGVSGLFTNPAMRKKET